MEKETIDEYKKFKQTVALVNKKNRLEEIKIAKRLQKQKITNNNKFEANSYDSWRKKVYAQDNYTCIVCGKNLALGNIHNMQAHHVLAKETYPELKLDPMNGVTLCYYDHKNSPQSPHLNALAFVETVLKIKKPEQYEYLKKYLNKYYGK